MIKKIMFVSRTAAENTPGWDDWAMISITEPDYIPARLMHGWYAVHRAEFHDTEPQKAISDSTVAMTDDHAIEIVDFVHAMAPHIEGVMVHCKGGISRSAAVAKWIAETYNLPFNHQHSSYNLHIYRQLVEANKRRGRRLK
jgi:predicted protein tyrosine phosphatase